MTLPDERYRAIKWARDFMRSLLIRSETPKVPAIIRRQAYSVLKHYPGDYDMERIAECPRCRKILQRDE